MPVPKKITSEQRFKQLFSLWTSGATEGERAAAERSMDAWLKKHGKTRADIPSILAQALADEAAAQPPPPPSDPRDAQPAPDVGKNITPLDLIRRMWETYIAFESPHEYVVASCWVLHCFAFDTFDTTPRLLFISPMEYAGKSTALKVIDKLVPYPKRSDDISAAALRFHMKAGRIMLLDEVDNLDLATKNTLRSAINANSRGASYDRMAGRQPATWAGYVPMALASIRELPRPQMSRSIVFYLVRASGERSESLRPFRADDTAELDRVYSFTRAWRQTAAVNPNPALPKGFYGRPADNWRPLVSVADACSPAWGALMREAMVEFARGYQDKHFLTELLEHIRDVFDARGDKVLSKTMTADLNAREDGPWSEWRGIHADQQPRALTQATLAGLLRMITPFSIHPKSMWLPGHQAGGKGYYRADFEKAWAAYCPSEEAGTPAQPSPIRHLRGV
jgi:hypothetical protein